MLKKVIKRGIWSLQFKVSDSVFCGFYLMILVLRPDNSPVGIAVCVGINRGGCSIISNNVVPASRSDRKSKLVFVLQKQLRLPLGRWFQTSETF